MCGRSFVRDADARIAYDERCGAVFGRNADLDGAASRRVTQRVFDEVDEDLREPVGIAVDARRFARKAQADAELLRARFERLDDVVGHAREIDVLAPQTQPSGFRAREFEKIFDELHHAIDFALDARQKYFAGFRIVGVDEHGLDHQIDRRERGCAVRARRS